MGINKLYMPDGCILAFKKIVILVVAVFFVALLCPFNYSSAVGDR